MKYVYFVSYTYRYTGIANTVSFGHNEVEMDQPVVRYIHLSEMMSRISARLKPDRLPIVSIINYQLLRVEPTTVAEPKGLKHSGSETTFTDDRGWQVGIYREEFEISFSRDRGGYCFALTKEHAAWLAEQLLAFVHAPQQP